MRWYIIRVLLRKELLRHRANRGGLALALLLVVASLLLSFFGRSPGQGGVLVGGVQRCFVDYWEDGPWVEYLRAHVPAELQAQLEFRPLSRIPTVRGVIFYPPGTTAIQLRPLPPSAGGPRYKVWAWYPAGNSAGLAPFEAWFWTESRRFFMKQIPGDLAQAPNPREPWHWVEAHRAFRRQVAGTQAAGVVPDLEAERSPLDQKGVDTRSTIATGLVVFALFFVCVYLLPSLTCEERERGVLLAQALSPASPAEILAAKFFFYPVVGIGLAALLAGLYQPAVLARGFFWLGLIVSAMGSLGIGLAISSLARTQRAASMGALCYMLAVALLLTICQQSNIPGLPYLALEYYSPRILHAALSDTVALYHWGNLIGATILSAGWILLAAELFRRRGWQ